MRSCKEVTRLISESLDWKLPLYLRVAIGVHLFMCKFCSQYKQQALFIREAIRRYSMQIEGVESSRITSLSGSPRAHQTCSTLQGLVISLHIEISV